MSCTEFVCSVKYGAKTYALPAGAVAAVKRALSSPTGLVPAEMKLLSKGKVVKSGETVAPGAKLMLVKQAPFARLITCRIVEIVTGSSSSPVHVPASASHDDIVEIALKALGVSADNDACTLRLFLPHIGSLMRVDFSLSEYIPVTGDADSEALFEIFLVPCAKGLRSDAVVDEEAMAAATKAELEAAAASRAHMEAELEAAVLREAVSASAPLLPPSIVEAAEEEAAAAASSTGAAPSSSSSSSYSSASLVPAKIRTGLMASLDEVQMVPVPVEVLAELEAYDAYDAEMRQLAQLPYAQARELMVAAEEARLEERCAALVASLAGPPELAAYGADHEPPSPSAARGLAAHSKKKTLCNTRV